MKVELKCFASLANPETCDFKESTTYELEDSETIDSLIQQAGLKSGEVSIAFVNNQIVGFDAVLKDGDRVGLAPTASALKSPFSCINRAASVNCGDW